MKIPKRIEVIKEFKKKKGKIIAVTPYHYPKALFRAFNILPVELWGPPKQNTLKSKSHIQTYVCSIVHSALSFLLDKKLEIADFLLIPHTCDSLQGLGSILLDFIKPKQRVFTLYIPRGRRSVDIDFLANEFKRIYNELSNITGLKPDKSLLQKYIEIEEVANKWLKKLLKKRRNLLLSDYEFYQIVRSKEYLPAEYFTQLAEETLKTYFTEKPIEKKGVILSGLVPEPMEILNVIWECEGVVAGDNLSSSGRRTYPLTEGKDPFLRMAKSIIYSPPDSSRGDSVNFRLEKLINLSKKTNSKGVIFFIVKFCEMEYFYLPFLRKGLKENGIESIVIDTDVNDSLSQQAITRLEVFLETLND